jgi:hypothetical protein
VTLEVKILPLRCHREQIRKQPRAGPDGWWSAPWEQDAAGQSGGVAGRRYWERRMPALLWRLLSPLPLRARDGDTGLTYMADFRSKARRSEPFESRHLLIALKNSDLGFGACLVLGVKKIDHELDILNKVSLQNYLSNSRAKSQESNEVFDRTIRECLL